MQLKCIYRCNQNTREERGQWKNTKLKKKALPTVIKQHQKVTNESPRREFQSFSTTTKKAPDTDILFCQLKIDNGKSKKH